MRRSRFLQPSLSHQVQKWTAAARGRRSLVSSMRTAGYGPVGPLPVWAAPDASPAGEVTTSSARPRSSSRAGSCYGSDPVSTASDCGTRSHFWDAIVGWPIYRVSRLFMAWVDRKGSSESALAGAPYSPNPLPEVEGCWSGCALAGLDPSQRQLRKCPHGYTRLRPCPAGLDH